MNPLELQLVQALEEIQKLKKENERLRQQLCLYAPEPESGGFEKTVDHSAEEVHLNSNPSERITLFPSLFRGRGDVYPTRWESKQGNSGNSPACRNEWPSIVRSCM